MAITGAFAVPHPPLIVPEVGKGKQRTIQATVDAYEAVMQQAAELKPDTVVIISPHSAMYSDYLHISPGKKAQGDFSQFGAAQIKAEVSYDAEFSGALADLATKNDIPAGFLGEKDPALDHGSFIPLYFLQKYMSRVRAVRLSLSGLSYASHYKYGKLIAEVSRSLNRNTVLIASGDLSHYLKEDGPYGFRKQGPELDKEITEALQTADFYRFLTIDESFADAAGECGLRSFIIMAGALDGMSVHAQLLSYEGPFGVGYAVASFVPTGKDPDRRFLERFEVNQLKAMQKKKSHEDPYVRLARYALEYAVQNHQTPPLPEDVPPELLERRAGAFVSIKKEGRLRGCIGTISPTQPTVAEEIIQNAVSSAVRDYRFDPVEPRELEQLTYSVDVLGEPRPISSISELDVKRYGVIVTAGMKRGLLLPDLDGVDTPAQQVEIALEKANIHPDEDYTMERFEVIRHV